MHRFPSFALLLLLSQAIACPVPSSSAPPAGASSGDVGGEGEGEGEADVGGEGEGEGEADVGGEGEGEGEGDVPSSGGGSSSDPSPGVFHVFVIAMENKSDAAIYGNANAPYLNDTLLPRFAHAGDYRDCLPRTVPSEPHYVWLESGTNVFDDHTFLFDSAPSATNSTADVDHISHALDAAGDGRTWRSYQQGLSASTGACPVHTSGVYAPKHDPFVFFQDVAGNPPSENNAFCAAHHRALTHDTLVADLAADDVDAYTFLTPDLCHDMHGNRACDNGCTSEGAPACIAAGDAWLAENVPPILAYLEHHDGVLLIVWDESEGADTQPFVVAGPRVKAGYTSQATLNHSSFTKSVEEMLGLGVSDRVTDAVDFADCFVDDRLPAQR